MLRGFIGDTDDDAARPVSFHRQVNCCGCCVAVHIAESFGSHLKNLADEAIVEGAAIECADNADTNAGDGFEFCRVAQKRIQEDVTLISGFSKVGDIFTEFFDAFAGHLDEVINGCHRMLTPRNGDVCATGLERRSHDLTESSQPDLQTDVGLNDAVVDAARNPPAFVFGSAGRHAIDQTDVFENRSHLIGELQQESRVFYAEAIASSGANEEISANPLVMTKWNGNEASAIEPFRQLCGVFEIEFRCSAVNIGIPTHECGWLPPTLGGVQRDTVGYHTLQEVANFRR